MDSPTAGAGDRLHHADADDAVVHVCVDERALVAQPLVETEPSDWELRSDGLIREAIFAFQAAYSAFTGGPGRIVLVAPTVGFTGAGGLVPYRTAVEGVRSLAKSAGVSGARRESR